MTDKQSIFCLGIVCCSVQGNEQITDLNVQPNSLNTSGPHYSQTFQQFIRGQIGLLIHRTIESFKLLLLYLVFAVSVLVVTLFAG